MQGGLLNPFFQNGIDIAGITGLSSSQGVETLRYALLVQASDLGEGVLSFNNAAAPNGAMVADRRLGGIGSYVEFIVPTTVGNGSGIPLCLTTSDDANYTWSTGAGTFLLSCYYVAGNSYFYTENGSSSGITLSTLPVAGDIIRLEKVSLTQIAIKRSNGGSFTTLVTRTVLTDFPNPFVKAMHVLAPAANRSLTVRGYGLRSRLLSVTGGQMPLIVFTGESNSGGRALNSVASPAERAERSSVKILNNTSLTFENLDIGTNNLLGHAGITPAAEHSWELQLARRVEASDFGIPLVYIVKTGQGGTKIVDWADGATSYLSTNCWQLLKDRVDAALALLQAAQPLPVQIYIFYSQGINDHVAGTDITTWKTNTIAHLAKIRTRYGSTVKIVMTKFPSATFSSYNTAIDEITASDQYTFSSPTEDPPFSSNHWTYNGQKLVADRLIDKAFNY
jgi:hypothetical protein